jgi:formylglycine-generating enzyme required for sulfatase activity/predicted Ser/Thr protein kinase
MSTPRAPFFGKYEVLGSLGNGSFGQVLKARHRTLNHLRALKRFPPMADGEEARRFEREAQILMALCQDEVHPHVVRLYDADVEQGFPYIDMEFIDGGDLSALLEQGPLPIAEVERLACEMGDALAYIHTHGVGHKDLKPGNIMRRARDGSFVLTDFGLAHSHDRAKSRLGWGTPEYMSPEQIEGVEDFRTVDGLRTFPADVYSLGVVLFECLTGQVPFPKEGTSSAAMYRLQTRIEKEVPPRVDTLRPDTPAWLAEVVAQCLEKDPALRPVRFPEAGSMPTRKDDPQQDGTGTMLFTLVSPQQVATSEPPGAAAHEGVLLADGGEVLVQPPEPVRRAEDRPELAPPGTTTHKPKPVWPWVAGGVTAALLLIALIANGVNNRPPEPDAIGMEFVSIPAGSFRMGSSSSEAGSDEQPVHEVRISRGFELGKYEVTQAEWEAVMGSNPSRFPGANRPVERVSWEDAQAFIRRLNARGDGYRYRLPTEAEWEYACRAGTPGERYGSLDAVAWHAGNSGDRTHDVGSKQPNAWGLHDCLGNVWEWVGDWYGGDYYQQSRGNDPPGPNNGDSRVCRGGSWYGNPRDVRAAYRNYGNPSYRGDGLGFRVARTVTL